MGIPIAPCSQIVKSLVRLPDSGWNTSLSSTILDLSRSSSLAASVYVRGGPFPSTTERGESTLSASNAFSKIAVQDPHQQPTASQATSEAVSIEKNSKTIPKHTVSKKSVVTKKKTSETTAKEGATVTKSTAERKRKLPDGLRENGETYMKNASSKAPKVDKIPKKRNVKASDPRKVQNGQIYLIPANSIANAFIAQQPLYLQQQQQQILQSTVYQNTISSSAVFVSSGSQQRKLDLSLRPSQTAAVKFSVQHRKQQQQQGNAATTPLTHTLSGLFPAGQVYKTILQETEQLRAANATLKQELEKYQNLFRDKQRLTAVVSHLINQPMVH